MATKTGEKPTIEATQIKDSGAERSAGAPTDSARSATTTVLGAPAAVAKTVASEVAGTARRPDAVLYWAGLAGLAVLGAIEWPVAAVVGVGVAIARGSSRTSGSVGS